MQALGVVVVVLVLLALLVLAMSVRVVKQYENGVLFRLGKVIGERGPGCGSSSRSSMCCSGSRCGS